MSHPSNGQGLRKPVARDFTSGAVQKVVLQDTLLHYSSLGGWGAAFLGALATAVGLLSPAGWAIVVGGAVFAAGSFVVNFFIRNEKFAEAHVQRLLERRREFDRMLIEGLREECERAGFERGLKEVEELWTAYDVLVQTVNENARFDDPEATRFRNLGDSLYEAGVFNLRKAAGMHRTLEAFEADRIQRELRVYQRQRAKADGEIADHLDREIETLSNQLEDYATLQKSYLDRLAGADVVEGELHRAAGKLAELGIGSVASGPIDWAGAAQQLEQAVEAAVESDEELRKLVALNR